MSTNNLNINNNNGASAGGGDASGQSMSPSGMSGTGTSTGTSASTSTNSSSGSGGANDLAQMQERNEQTLTDIQNLQSIEKDLYSDLEKSSAANLLTSDNKTKLINKINEISQMRMNLYSNLRNSYSFYQNNVIGTKQTTDEQTAAVNIVENELNAAKERLKSLQDDQYNKLRYVEINDYYGKRYNDHSSIMKIVIMICIPLLLLSILANKGIVPQGVYNILLILIVVGGAIYIGSKLIIMSNRDKMNYDQFDWYFDPSAQTKSSTTTPQDALAVAGDSSAGAGSDAGAGGGGGAGGAGDYSIFAEPAHAFLTGSGSSGVGTSANASGNSCSVPNKNSTNGNSNSNGNGDSDSGVPNNIKESMLSGLLPGNYSKRSHFILNGEMSEHESHIDPQLNNYIVF